MQPVTSPDEAANILNTWSLNPKSKSIPLVEKAIEILLHTLIDPSSSKQAKSLIMQKFKNLEINLSEILKRDQVEETVIISGEESKLPFQLRRGVETIHQILRAEAEVPPEIKEHLAYHSNILDKGMSDLAKMLMEDKDIDGEKEVKKLIKFYTDRILNPLPNGVYILRKSGTKFDDAENYFFSISYVHNNRISHIRLKKR